MHSVTISHAFPSKYISTGAGAEPKRTISKTILNPLLQGGWTIPKSGRTKGVRQNRWSLPYAWSGEDQYHSNMWIRML